MLRLRDLAVVTALVIVVVLVACSACGFLTEGFHAPYTYDGTDDFTYMAAVKQLTQESWVWRTDRLGAPYGKAVYDYPATLLMNTEFLMIKFWTMFTDSVPVIVNIQFMFTFVLCSITAFLVFRKMCLNRLLAVCGALLFSFAPYLFGRGIAHYCLTACYFVPISCYLCYISYQCEKLLSFDKSFFSIRTLLILFACLLIANNGIGYYPFFTCFLLCVTAVCKLFETKRLKSVLPQLKLIFLIIVFFLVALIPALIYHMNNGVNEIASRYPWDAELYGLKIAQLFIPLYTHWAEYFYWDYNLYMPLVNENATAYLGVIGFIGFLIGIISLFCYTKLGLGEKRDRDLFLLSRLNLAGVLFMSVGGFMSLLAVLSRVYVLRSFNRISIYIMFCSLTILGVVIQALLDRIKRSSLKMICCVLIIGMTIFGLWDQTPTLYNDGTKLRATKEAWDVDEAFIRQIENKLNNGDMVFQLPYHKYPEEGPVEHMNDYHLLTGYLHSDALRWSYGGIKGREGDKWNEYVSQLETNEMVQTLVSSGFRGIYVDTRAYSTEKLNELVNNLQRATETVAIESANSNLLFYNLNPYITNHPETLTLKPLVLEDIV